jgi:dephospho-CoA kinase
MSATSSRVILGVTGRIGSGKSEAAHYLEREYGFQYLRYSLVLAEWRNTDPTAKKRLQEVGWEIMGGDHQRELNQRLISKLDANRDAAVDGLRHPVDVQSLSSAGRPFALLYIDTPAKNRFERLQARYTSWDEFVIADSHPVESHIEELRKCATAVISGATTFEEFYQAVDAVLKRFVSGSNL